MLSNRNHNEEDCVLATCDTQSVEVPPGKPMCGWRRPPFPSWSAGVTSHKLVWSETHWLSFGAGSVDALEWDTVPMARGAGGLSCCLLQHPRRDLIPLCPKVYLAMQGERKWNFLSQRLMNVDPLSPFGYKATHVIQFFIFPMVVAILHTGHFCCYNSVLQSPVPLLHKDQSCHTTSSPNVLILSMFGRNLQIIQRPCE